MMTVYILILIITVPFEFSILSGDINHSGLPFVRQWRSIDYSKAPGIISQLEITNRVYARGVYHQVTMKYNF
jgi:hypothetical protein